MFAIFLECFYGTFSAITCVNLLLMRRPRPSEGSAVSEEPNQRVCILIPARNEERNLARLLPGLLGSGSHGTSRPKVYVFDDESSDGTAQVIRNSGAILLQPREPLPDGWTGKNRACHELARAAAEDANTEWILFLDADVYPEPGFVAGIESLIQSLPRQTSVVSGFPRIIPGEGIEPLFLGWVGWVLLATNPYGLVTASGKGHNRFTNGQFGLWRMQTYTDLWPNKLLKGRILEDVLIGRLCADKGIGVEVVNLSRVMAVKMYDNWRQTLDGMSKNSYEITGSTVGSIGLAALLAFVAWGWLLAGSAKYICLALLLLSGLFACFTVRAKPYGVILLPIAITIGGFTILRSMAWHKKGAVTWKGRQYPGHGS